MSDCTTPQTAAASATPTEFDPFTAGQAPDPYGVYQWLRDEHPIYHSERYGFYAVSRYEDVRMVSRDWKTFSNRDGVDVDRTSTIGGPNFLDMDPPEHDYWRRLFQSRFSAKTIRGELMAVIDAEAARLLDEALADDPDEVDLAARFAWELPIAVTGYLLAVPKADQHMLANDLRVWQERDPGDIVPPPRSVAAGARLNEYFAELVMERRRDLGDDLVSLMLTAERDGHLLPEADVMGNTLFFLDAGTHTTSSLISQAIVLLDRHPDQREWLKADRDRMSGAVEEFLRYEAPLRFLRRVTATEVTLHNETVPEGVDVLVLYGAANRDERRWSDADRFNITRKPERHMGLGEGIHHCLGAPIARFETAIAVQAIIDRLPDYEISGPVELIRSHMLNGYTSVPVATGCSR